VKVQIAHLKAEGQAHWGRVGQALEMIEQARTAGVDIGYDVYPYTAWNTSLAQMLPAWAREGELTAVLLRLTDLPIRAKIIEEITQEAEADPGRWERRLLASADSKGNRGLLGLTIEDISAQRGTPPVETVLNLLVEEKLDAGMVGFGMCEEDVRKVLSHPLATIGSDSAATAPYGILGDQHPHPRTYGSFVRVLGHYSRDEGVFPLEEAVAKMTSRAADRLGLSDRGRLAPGCAADICIFDPATIADTATYQQPQQYPAGVRWVLVNGVVEIDGTEHQEQGPGKVLVR
jgi:N-acyl-D-amino-acid deacylase